MVPFPSVPKLRGELKRSEVRGEFRYQLTTEEFVLQRETRTYRIALDSILGLVPCHTEATAPAHLPGIGERYKIVATVMHVVLPGRVIEQQQVSFYTKLSPGFAGQLTKALQAC